MPVPVDVVNVFRAPDALPGIARDAVAIGAGALWCQFASRLTGSSDLYEHTGRRPVASINFITCHDGFTLTDLVSYERKHNEANGEDNRDGESHNRSVNCGVEGPSDDPDVNALRGLLKRNLLATLFLSQGVPMLSHGDELGRTQRGNNNAYCQDNVLSWIDWSAVDQELLGFVQRLAELRGAHPVFRRRRFFDGEPVAATPRLPDQPPVASAGGSIQVGGHAVLVMVRAA